MQFGVIFFHKETRETETKIELCVTELSQLQFSQPAWANTANQSPLCQPFFSLFNYHHLWHQLGRQCFGHSLKMHPIKEFELNVFQNSNQITNLLY